MLGKAGTIQRKLMRMLLLVSGIILLVTCTSFFAYEIFTFRQTTTNQLSTLGEIIAANSTAALAFDDADNANEILNALRAEKHIISACIYNKDGKLFSHYPADGPTHVFPAVPQRESYQFEDAYLVGFQPIMQGGKKLGTLYLKSDMKAMYDRLRLYGLITLTVVIVSIVLAYMLSKILQRGISKPVQLLAETAQAISSKKDYSVRAIKITDDELGLLTDAFNQMLNQIQLQTTEIVTFNQQLEQMVKDRTQELEAANKEMESFTYSVSHDLRAPLRGIHSYTKILEEDYSSAIDGEGKKIIEVIIRNSRKMGQLIDDLLAFARLGRKEINSHDVDMDALVRSVVEELLQSTDRNKIEINIQHLLPASGDQSLIKQVWVNLISNAIKYSGKKEKAIIEIGSYPKGDMNVYYVRDNGVGFEMQYYNKLFGVFQRLHSQEEFEGTGVGLAITQRVVQKHKGEIWADSRVNEGATFQFTLPMNNKK